MSLKLVSLASGSKGNATLILSNSTAILVDAGVSYSRISSELSDFGLKPSDLDGVVTRFDEVVGLDRLKAIHVNDSMNVFGAHKDRHEKIGKGKIGLDAFRRIVNHPKLRDLPFYLETPCDLQGYKEEIALLKSLREEG